MGRKNLTYGNRTKLASAREAAGLTQQELATSASLSLSTYQHIEYGSDPHLSSMVSICDALEKANKKAGRRKKSREIFMEVFYERPTHCDRERDTEPTAPADL